VTEVEEMDTGPLGNMDRAAREKAEEDGRGVAEVVLKDFRDAAAEATDEDEDEDGRCPDNTRPSLPTETRFFRAEEEDAEDLLSLLSRTTADRMDHGVGEEEEEERRGGEEEDYAECNAEDDARHQEAAVRFERSPVPPPDEDERYFLCSPLPPSRPSLLLRLRNPRL
jgi:hypothetical protein